MQLYGLAWLMQRVPKPANAAPRPERTGAAIGEQPGRYALEDHQHETMRSTTYVTLDASAKAKAMFTRSYVRRPGLNLTETDAVIDSQVLVLRGLDWVLDERGAYIGVWVQGRRSRALPKLEAVSGLLSAVIAGINALVTVLSGYDLFAGSAAGASVSVVAYSRTDTA